MLSVDPPIADYHLIKKLVCHFNKEVEVTIITCKSQELLQFKSLLHEYMSINKHTKFSIQCKETNNNTPMWVKQELKRTDTHKSENKHRYGKAEYKEKPMFNNAVSTLVIENKSYFVLT